LQAQVDAQLLEQGAFTPLELLFNSGRLLYSDYEGWRRREIELLDGALMGNVDNIKAEIEKAVGYAKRIGLVEQPQEFHAWHTRSTQDTGRSDRPLRISLDPQLQRLIGSRYVRAQSVPQMDLFFDNPVVALTNGIVQALTRRNLADAQRQLDQLYAQAPTHSDLPAFDQLLAALGRVGQPVEEPRREMASLLEITPTARRLLGAQSRDLLSPLWRQLAEALAGSAFNPDEPDLHRSFALTQAQDWVGVSECVVSEPRWQWHAPLCLRLAESAFSRRRRVDALAAWCHVCWRAPITANASVDKLRQPELTALWLRFQDEEEPLAEVDFPAWLLLQEPGLALQLPAELAPSEEPAEQQYRLVHRWIQARRARCQDEEFGFRKELQVSNPALFRLLKQSV
jgi:hypothetical protein